MARTEREWHPNFLEYMDTIINHPNYKGLSIVKKADGTWSWFAPKQTEIGKKRIEWCENKAKEFGIPIGPGVYATVMREIHPTKWKVCQTCGNLMSIYYHYPSVYFLKKINNFFNVEYNEIDHISDIWDDLVERGHTNNDIGLFLIREGNLSLDATDKNLIIDMLEEKCRVFGMKLLSPGAMSNFPDRFDGFHTYNRCCRASQDKGRSKENLKSYTKDRRAYEYWSDGNIHAANQFMGSSLFKDITADHIGPISLGFIHDSRFIQPLHGSDNSSKRDRLQIEDIIKIIEIENRTNIYGMSWYSRLLWDYIKSNYATNVTKISTEYRDALKQNMSNFMFILYTILENCKKQGEYFLEETLLKPNYQYFNNSYTFNEQGDIIGQTTRHFTDRNLYETERYKRIAFESVYEYYEKDNRNVKAKLSLEEERLLANLCNSVNANSITIIQFKDQLNSLVESIQNRILENL